MVGPAKVTRRKAQQPFLLKYGLTRNIIDKARKAQRQRPTPPIVATEEVYPISTFSNIQITSDETTHNPTEESALVLTDGQYVNYQDRFSTDMVLDYEKMKPNIERVATLKEKLKGMDVQKEDDGFIGVIKTYPFYYLNRCSLKVLNLNYAFGNIISVNIRNGVRIGDFCGAPGGFAYFLSNFYISKDLYIHLITKPPFDNSVLTVHKKVKDDPKVHITYLDITTVQDHDKYIESLQGMKLDFILADGGIDYTNNEHMQEYASRELYLGQAVLMLKTLKTNGFFICKFFDTYRVESSTLLYLLCFVFEEIKVCKPKISRAPNSEIYILFKGYTPNNELTEYLDGIQYNSSNTYKIHHIKSLISDTEEQSSRFNKFVTEMRHIHKTLATNQAAALEKYIGSVKQARLHNNAFAYLRVWLEMFKN